MSTILLVDNDKNVTSALERMFFETSPVVFVSTSPNEALDILENNHVDMIISEFMFQNIDGYEFLRRVKQINPHIIRIIVSGYVEEDLTLHTIVSHVGDIFIAKPWDNDELYHKIEQFLYLKNTLFSLEYNSSPADIFPYCMLPQSFKLIEMIDRNDTLSLVIKHIERDPLLALHVLQIVNSSFFPLNTLSIKKSLTYMGSSVLKKVITTSQFVSAHRLYDQNKHCFDSLYTMVKHKRKCVTKLYEHCFHRALPEEERGILALNDIGKYIYFFMNEKCNTNELFFSTRRFEGDEISQAMYQLKKNFLLWSNIILPHNTYSHDIKHETVGAVIPLIDIVEHFLDKRTIEDKRLLEIMEILQVTDAVFSDLERQILE